MPTVLVMRLSDLIGATPTMSRVSSQFHQRFLSSSANCKAANVVQMIRLPIREIGSAKKGSLILGNFYNVWALGAKVWDAIMKVQEP